MNVQKAVTQDYVEEMIDALARCTSHLRWLRARVTLAMLEGDGDVAAMMTRELARSSAEFASDVKAFGEDFKHA